MENEPKLFKSLKLELEPGIYYWCSCPDKEDMVLCDSSHTDCMPFEFEITEQRLRSYCTCKLTKTPPFCDSTHKELNAKILEDFEASKTDPNKLEINE